MESLKGNSDRKQNVQMRRFINDPHSREQPLKILEQKVSVFEKTQHAQIRISFTAWRDISGILAFALRNSALIDCRYDNEPIRRRKNRPAAGRRDHRYAFRFTDGSLREARAPRCSWNRIFARIRSRECCRSRRGDLYRGPLFAPERVARRARSSCTPLCRNSRFGPLRDLQKLSRNSGGGRNGQDRVSHHDGGRRAAGYRFKSIARFLRTRCALNRAYTRSKQCGGARRSFRSERVASGWSLRVWSRSRA